MKQNGNHHTQSELLDIALQAIETAKKKGATQAEARIIKDNALNAEIRNGKLENLNHHQSKMLIVRIFRQNAHASAATHTSAATAEFSQNGIQNVINRALEIAHYTPEDPYSRLADKQEIIQSIPETDIYDDTELSAELCETLARNTEEAAMSVKGITQVASAYAGCLHRHIILATSKGCAQHYQKSNFHLGCHAIAGTGTNMESDYEYDQKIYFNDLENPASIGEKAAQRARQNLNPKKIKSDQMPIILDPRIGAQFIDIITQALAGDAIVQASSFLKDKINTQIAHKTLTLIDDPLRKKGLATKPFDAEGLPSKKLTLIENGCLKAYLLDIATAQQLKMKSNAHASGTTSIRPAPTNTYIKAGNITPENMIKNCKKALYITALLGNGANIASGNYSCGVKGFLIQNGEKTHPVSEITIAGDLNQILKMIQPANNLETNRAFNAPTLYIDQMTVAGK